MSVLNNLTTIPSQAPISQVSFSHPSRSPTRVAIASIDHHVYVAPYNSLFESDGSEPSEKDIIKWEAHDAPVYVVSSRNNKFGSVLLMGVFFLKVKWAQLLEVLMELSISGKRVCVALF
jgi:hypothetical protein